MRTVRKFALLILIAMFMFNFVSCETNDVEKSVDYLQYSFTNTLWTRKAEHDTENIRFGSDGSYAYWCACGNPVNDSDLNEGYTYDDATNTITVKYIETTEETVSTIIIEECNNVSIKLNFDGEIREFVKANNQLK